MNSMVRLWIMMLVVGRLGLCSSQYMMHLSCLSWCREVGMRRWKDELGVTCRPG